MREVREPAVVAVVRTRPETVLDDYARLLALAGLDAIAAPDAVDSRSAGGPALDLCLDREPGPIAALPAAASPPWQVEGVLRALLAAGWPTARLTVRAPGVTRPDREPARSWARVLAACGVDPLGEAPGARAGSTPCLLAASLRTQRWLGLSGCLGVLAAHVVGPGGLADRDRLVEAWRESGADRRLAGGVLDATVCGDGDDAATLVPVAAHLLLASKDPVAVDSVAARLVGLAPGQLPLLHAAAAAGVGRVDPARIRLVGDRVDRLPELGLKAAAGYRDPRQTGSRWLRRLARFQPSVPLAALTARRRRRQHETSPWGRLRRHYQDGNLHAGGAT